MKAGVERTLTQQLPFAYAPLKLSTPASTIYDLVRYAPKIGDIERAAETIAPMLIRVGARQLARVLRAENELATVQRLGYVLHALGADKLASVVAR